MWLCPLQETRWTQVSIDEPVEVTNGVKPLLEGLVKNKSGHRIQLDSVCLLGSTNYLVGGRGRDSGGRATSNGAKLGEGISRGFNHRKSKDTGEERQHSGS